MSLSKRCRPKRCLLRQSLPITATYRQSVSAFLLLLSLRASKTLCCKVSIVWVATKPPIKSLCVILILPGTNKKVWKTKNQTITLRKEDGRESTVRIMHHRWEIRSSDSRVTPAVALLTSPAQISWQRLSTPLAFTKKINAAINLSKKLQHSYVIQTLVELKGLLYSPQITKCLTPKSRLNRFRISTPLYSPNKTLTTTNPASQTWFIFQIIKPSHAHPLPHSSRADSQCRPLSANKCLC